MNRAVASFPATLVDALLERFGAGDAPALRCDGRVVTYAELDRRSGIIAAALRARGLGAESLIALAMPRSERLVCGVIGCWRAGAAFLPVDPSYPVERLRYMLADAQPALVVCDEDRSTWAPEAIASAVLEREGASAPTPSPTRPHDEGLAYVIYTSGSTGKPKGVEVPLRGLRNLARNQIRDFAIDADSRVLQFASPSFDAFVAELLSALLAGASLVIGTQTELRPGHELVALCRREGVTVTTFPPSLLAILDPQDFPSLRTIASAGEACTAEIVRRWSSSARRFVNAYGPTESTVCATECVLTGLDVNLGPPPIGAALEGVETLVLDGDLRPAAAGSTGELFVAGLGVARGYRARPELTAERFLPHAAVAGARMYRTGDVVRQEGGVLRFVGRVDNQVKLRGFRVELGEVEDALCGLPGVAAAAAGVSGNALVAHVVLRGEASIPIASLRAQLAARLPPYMIPDSIGFVAELPRGPNGKVDRRLLPPLAAGRPPSWPPAVAASDEGEAAIVQLFQQVLGIAECGVTDDFFALGGHSIAAALLLARLADQQGHPVALEALLTNRTARELAAYVRSARNSSMGVQRPPCLVSLHPAEVGSSTAGAPPLFLFHPVSGNVSCYVPVAAEAGRDRAVYGVQSLRFCGQPTIGSSFSAMCAGYVAPLLAAFPDGPFLLGGWSVGGSIAVEVARLLAKAGREVPLVLLFDAWSPSLHPRPAPVLDDGLLSYLFIKNNLGRVTGVDLSITPAELAALDPPRRIAAVHSWAVTLGLYPPGASGDEIQLLLATFSEMLRAFMIYDPLPYEGPVLHIQATQPAPGHPRPPTLGWERLLPNCHNVFIPESSHFTFISPALVERFAPLVRDALRKASR